MRFVASASVFFVALSLTACGLGSSRGVGGASTTMDVAAINGTFTAKQLCWQFNTFQELQRSVDSEGLVAADGAGGWAPTTLDAFFTPKDIDCADDKVTTKSVKMVGDVEITFVDEFVPNADGSAELVKMERVGSRAPEKYAWRSRFSGDGYNAMKLREEYSFTYSYGENTQPLHDFFASPGTAERCPNVEAELAEKGAKLVVGVTTTQIRETSLTRRANGKYGYTYGSAADAEVTFRTDNDLSFTCRDPMALLTRN